MPLCLAGKAADRFRLSLILSRRPLMSIITEGPIALLSPLVEERDALFERLTDVGTQGIGTLQVATGKLDGRSVALAESGVGKVASAAIATLIAKSLDCRAIVVCGVAGG